MLVKCFAVDAKAKEAAEKERQENMLFEPGEYEIVFHDNCYFLFRENQVLGEFWVVSNEAERNFFREMRNEEPIIEE